MQKKKLRINSGFTKLGDMYIARNILFFLFLMLLGVIYISNSHLAMKRVREINRLTENVKIKRWYFIQALSQEMQKTKLSQVKKDVADIGLVELLEPPQVIIKHNEIKP